MTADPISSYAVEAYAAGWARSGGPMTSRVKAGAVAASRLAADHARHPGILEVALHLGRLEGIWATVYERRERLTADHTALILAAWRQAIRSLDVGTFITRYRAAEFLEADLELAARRATARRSALGLLSAIHFTDSYPHLQAVVADAVRAGRAEGYVAAQRILASRTPTEAEDDWSIDFAGYYNQLELLDDWPALSDRWIQRLIDGASTDLGNRLAALARDGADYQTMLNAASDVLDGGDVRAVSTLIDYAMGDALVQGSLNLYASENVRTVDWLDAGDGRVCPRCADNAANGPYPVAGFPDCPAHPFCRCSPAPVVSDLPALTPEGA